MGFRKVNLKLQKKMRAKGMDDTLIAELTGLSIPVLKAQLDKSS